MYINTTWKGETCSVHAWLELINAGAGVQRRLLSPQEVGGVMCVVLNLLPSCSTHKRPARINRHTYTHACAHPRIHAGTHTLTDTQTHTQTDSDTHTHTHTHTNVRVQIDR